jgi:hypothetical protein
MKQPSLVLIPLYGIACLAALSTAAAEPADQSAGDQFTFKFRGSQPLIYAFDIKTTNNKTISKEAASGVANDVVTRSVVHSRYKVRLTPVPGAAPGETLVHYEPFDVEQDVETTQGQSRFDVTMQGWEVKAQQNGITVIDTTRQIGIGQAKNFRNSLTWLLLSGWMVFDAQGKVSKIQGDIPFVESWKDSLKSLSGFWRVVLPDHPVAVGEHWENLVVAKESGGCTLEGDGVTNVFQFTRTADSVTNGATVANFDITGTENDTDVTAYFDQNGQNTSINLPRLSDFATGSFQFDPRRGILTDITVTDNGTLLMNMLSQGTTITANGKIDTETHIYLLP